VGENPVEELRPGIHRFLHIDGAGVFRHLALCAKALNHMNIIRSSALALSAAMLTSAPAAAATLFQWTGPGSNGHFYSVTDTVSTWSEANVQATLTGGYLASVRSMEENNFLQATFFPEVAEAFWIGYTDEASEGAFGWTSGEPVDFTNWGPGEPNNSTPFWSPSGEDYTAINWQFAVGINAQRGLWNDTPNAGTTNSNTAEQRYRAIIEYTVPEPSGAVFAAAGCLMMGWRRQRRGDR
jgi:Lectin C-type domain